MRLGYALYSDRSEISLRFLARGGEAPTLDTWRARLAAAVDFRESLKIDATAYRLVHGEADRLPGLVVDRYGSCLVLQALVQGVDRLLPELTQMLVDRLQPDGILARNDPRVRLLEGLDQSVTVLYGTVPETIDVREGRSATRLTRITGRRPACSSISVRIVSPPQATPTAARSMPSATTAALPWPWPRHAPR